MGELWHKMRYTTGWNKSMKQIPTKVWPIIFDPPCIFQSKIDQGTSFKKNFQVQDLLK